MKKKILSLLTAFAMVFGILVAPFTTASADTTLTPDAETTKSVTLHKLIMTKQELKDWKSEDIETKGYNGTQDMNALKALLGQDHTAHEVAGVYFAFKYNDGPNNGKYVTIKEEAGKDPVYGAVESLDATADQLGEGFKLLAGKTEANGIKFITKGLKGNFLIEEIHDKSTYKNEDGSVITDNKAVPVEITLPLVNKDGVVPEAHVYPKNTEDKPQIDKNFSEAEANKYMSEEEKTNLKNAIEHKAAFEKAKKLYPTTSEEYTKAQNAYTQDDKALIEKWGIDFEANTRGKQTLDKKVGDDVEYTVVTDIPAQTKWAQAYWDDKMTEGLTFNKGSLSVELEILNEDGVNKGKYTKVELTNDTDYKVTETDNGFVLNFEKPGLDKLNNKAQNQKITLKYSAKINNTTVTDVPESNDVTFHYGNTKGKGNTPQPNKPKDGKITVTKTMKDGQEWPAKGIQVQLVNANTGENVGEAVTLTSTKTTHTWEKLDAETEYKVVELTTGYDVVYGKGADNALGQISIDNYKTPNPPPLNPSEPKVVTGGKKFVKTNEKLGNEQERLAGAEFLVTQRFDKDGKIIKNNDKTEVKTTKYLAYKSATATSAEATAYDTAEKNYNDFIKAYNKHVAEIKEANEKKEASAPAQKVFPWTNGSDTYNDENAVKAKLKELKDLRDKAYKAARSSYTWIDANDAADAKTKGALVLTSDNQGRFEVTGLAYGDYQLVELTAPEGYAKLTGNEEFLKFEIKKNSYTTEDVNIDYNTDDDDTSNSAQQVINKKVTIPQTGGIGSLIFIVAGLAIMGGAFVAYKKSQAVEA